MYNWSYQTNGTGQYLIYLDNFLASSKQRQVDKIKGFIRTFYIVFVAKLKLLAQSFSRVNSQLDWPVYLQ